MIHGESSFITSYIVGLHCLGMLLSASVSRWITSSVRRVRHVRSLSSPSSRHADVYSLDEGGFYTRNVFDDINYLLVPDAHY